MPHLSLDYLIGRAAMKPFSIFSLVLIACAPVEARPLEVLVVGNRDQAVTLFETTKQKYEFVAVSRGEVTFPIPRFQSVIPIPKELQVDGTSHSAIAALIINKSGKVIDVAIVESTNELISQSIHKNIVRWVFVPARKKGKAVAFMILAPVKFTVVATD